MTERLEELARRREADQGVMSLFGELAGGGDPIFDDARVPIPEHDFDKASRLAFEKEMLGLYLSDHPLKGVEDHVIGYRPVSGLIGASASSVYSMSPFQ